MVGQPEDGAVADGGDHREQSTDPLHRGRIVLPAGACRRSAAASTMAASIQERWCDRGDKVPVCAVSSAMVLRGHRALRSPRSRLRCVLTIRNGAVLWDSEGLARRTG